MTSTIAARNEQTLRRFYALFDQPAFRKGDFSALHEILSPQFEDLDPIPGQGPGIDGLAGAFASFYASFEDFSVQTDAVVADERSGAVRLTFRGTHTGPFGGAPATGKRFEIHGMNFITFDVEGRPATRRGIADWGALIAQLGLDLSPASANLARVRATYEAFGRGDVPGILANLRPDVAWRSGYPDVVPFGGTFSGNEGVVRFLTRVGESIEVLAFAPETMTADAERVVVLGSERARVRANGREYENAWVHVFRFDGDRIVEIRTYNDTARVVAAFAG